MDLDDVVGEILGQAGLTGTIDQPFAVEKAERELLVVARCPHRHRERLAVNADLEWFLDRDDVLDAVVFDLCVRARHHAKLTRSEAPAVQGRYEPGETSRRDRALSAKPPLSSPAKTNPCSAARTDPHRVDLRHHRPARTPATRRRRHRPAREATSGSAPNRRSALRPPSTHPGARRANARYAAATARERPLSGQSGRPAAVSRRAKLPRTPFGDLPPEVVEPVDVGVQRRRAHLHALGKPARVSAGRIRPRPRPSPPNADDPLGVVPGAPHQPPALVDRRIHRRAGLADRLTMADDKQRRVKGAQARAPTRGPYRGPTSPIVASGKRQ